MEYQIHFGCHAFCVPSVVVDNLIKLAKEDHLKILLYLLRYPDKQFTASQIASYFRMPEVQAEEALEFWINANILQEKSKDIHPELLPPAISAPVPNPSPPPEPPATSESKPEPKKLPEGNLFQFFSRENISEMVDSSPELRKLIRLAEEKYYRKPIYGAPLNSLVWMHEYLGMPAEVILILLQYCLDTDKMQQKYIDSVAIGWYEDDILTKETAEQKVHELMEFYTYKNYICRLFAIDKLSKNETELIELWQTMSFSEELLKYAYELSVEATHKVNFKYIHPILMEWHDNHITEVAEAQKKHDEYIKRYVEKKKKGRKKKVVHDIIREQEMEEIGKYLTLVD